MSEFDRSVENVGNVVFLEHVNTRVPDQQLATAFYVAGLGLTRDPYLMTGINNMWINAGRSQFHLPTGQPQVLRGHTGLVIPGRAELLQRLSAIEAMLAGTQFGYSESASYVEAICPWGNRIRCYEPAPQFGNLRIGMPYVELNVPMGTAAGITRFYNAVMTTPARVTEDNGTAIAVASVGAGQELRFRETDAVQPEFDGHHIAVYLADFSGPYDQLIELGLISEESDQHQYRFVDLVDPDDGRVLFQLEHEVRSMRHPLYARSHVNRNPAQSNRVFAPGHEDAAWALPATG
jgi:catechol 2,3-dioxygenase-like lactoylglutathione lyase family enzyme